MYESAAACACLLLHQIPLEIVRAVSCHTGAGQVQSTAPVLSATEPFLHPPAILVTPDY